MPDGEDAVRVHSGAAQAAGRPGGRIDGAGARGGSARMAVSAVTPWVRTIVICDDVSASLTENGVFTLQGVRLQLEAPSLPCRAALVLFLLLSSPRKWKYGGKILVVNERSDRPIRYVKLLATSRKTTNCCLCTLESANACFPKPTSTVLRSFFPRGTAARPSRANTRSPCFRGRSERCPGKPPRRRGLLLCRASLPSSSPTRPSRPLWTSSANGKSESRGDARQKQTAMMREPHRTPRRKEEDNSTPVFGISWHLGAGAHRVFGGQSGDNGCHIFFL